MQLESTDTTIPKSRLWRTIFQMHRNTTQWIPPFTREEIFSSLPKQEILQHHGVVNLLDDVQILQHRDGTLTKRVHLVQMLHSNESLAIFDDFTKWFQPPFNKLKVEKAITYLPKSDSPQDGFDEFPARIEKHSMNAWGQKATSIHFSYLRPGAIVEFVIHVDFFSIEPMEPGTWDHFFLQTIEPTQKRRVVIGVADPFEAKIETAHSSFASRSYSIEEYQFFEWNLENIEGVEQDRFLPHPRDFMPWVEMATTRTWIRIQWLYEQEILGLVPPVWQLQNTIDEMNWGKEDSLLEKTKKIYEYVASSIRYGRSPSELDLRTTRDFSKMLEEQRGDCKDKSALMVHLCQQIGVQAYVALIVTTNEGIQSSLPTSYFNHALVCVEIEDDVFWCDPAAGYFSFGELPLHSQDTWALLLQSNRTSLIKVPKATPQEHSLRRKSSGNTDEDGNYHFTSQLEGTGEQAARFRSVFENRLPESILSLFNGIFNQEWTGYQFLRFKNLLDQEGKISFEVEGVCRQKMQFIRDLMLLQIPWMAPLHFATEILTMQERTLPIGGLDKAFFEDIHELPIPKGYKSYALPIEKEIQNEFCDYFLRIEEKDEKIHCLRRFVQKGGMVEKYKIPDFIEFWEQSMKADSTLLVFVKQENTVF